MNDAKLRGLAAMLAYGGMTHPLTGRPILIDEEGYPETEKGITIQSDLINNGRFTNIPSIWNGKHLSESGSLANALLGPQSWPSFDTLEQAVGASRNRSYWLGKTMPKPRTPK